MIWISALVALGLAIGAVATTLALDRPVMTALNSRIEAGEWGSPSIVAAATIVAIIALFAAQLTLRSMVSEDEAAEEQALEDRFGEIRAEIEQLKASDRYIDSGRLRSGQIYLVRDEPDAERGDDVREITAEVYDEEGDLRYVIVVHLFAGALYWGYDSAWTVVDRDGQQTDLAEFLNRRDTQTLLAEFNRLIGIGVSSNAHDPSRDLAAQRAINLAGLLAQHGISDNDTQKAVGVSFGNYLGEPADSRARPQTGQRAIIIVGVRTMRGDPPTQSLLSEILGKVEVDDIDFAQYENLQAGNSPVWFETKALAGAD